LPERADFDYAGSGQVKNASDALQRQAYQHSQTGFANSPLDTKDLIKMVGGAPVVIKLLEGTQGKGVVLAEPKSGGECDQRVQSLKANILVQELSRNPRVLICAVL
jgi:ribosomal protein S6--L-glutamate ligase